MRELPKINLQLLIAVLLLSVLMAACTVEQGDGAATPMPAAIEITSAHLAALDRLIAALQDDGTAVTNEGQQPQGMFAGAVMWRLKVNGTAVNVFEFASESARQAVSDNISPTGSEYTVTDGDTIAVTYWDGEGVPHFWMLENLLINYWGEDTAVLDPLNAILGQPFADGSRPYRPEPNSGAVAGIGEYGVSFQYDPYLAAGVQSRIEDAYTTDSGMDYLLLPQHIAFTFPNSYADADPLLQRQQLNLETMPQIVVYPAATYSAMQPLAGRQVELLQDLLAKRPSTPGGIMPYLPLVNAAQVFHSQVAYLTFANGAGVRYVTAFSQEASPTTNQQLIYAFQGLTDDGQYYVAAFFPVKTAVLPDTVQVDDWEAFSLNYATYVVETKAALNDLSSSDFTPDLTLLDAVVTSLRVEPDVALGGVETAVSPVALGGRRAIGVYQVYDSDNSLYRLYRVEMDGSPRQVAEQRYPLLPAPDAAHAVYMDDDHRLWLVDLADGSEKQLAEGSDLSGLQVWGDAHTLLVGVYLPADESEGLSLSTGHVVTLDIDSSELQIIEEEFLSLGRPAMASDGQSIAYDISPFETDGTTGRIYHPDTGSRPLDPALFAGLEGEGPCNLYNPAWSPDGRQLAWLCSEEAGSHLVVFDLVRQTAMTVFTWQPAHLALCRPRRYGALTGNGWQSKSGPTMKTNRAYGSCRLTVRWPGYTFQPATTPFG